MIVAVDTPHGLANAHLYPADQPRAALVLGHGAAGGVAARDLVTVAEEARSENVSVALVEQPYRVAGRRSTLGRPSPRRGVDPRGRAVSRRGARAPPGVTGGRSSGARVACRTADAVGAVGVLCLAVPLVAPSDKSRQEELDGVSGPVLVVQGERDRFGVPGRPACARSP